MKKILLEELQNIEYNILCDFAKICEKYNLRYGLAGGTVLGAIRHGGFIPWDDDIDIEMPRKDFREFCEIFSKELPEHLKLSSPYNDYTWYNGYAKIYDLRTYMVESPEDMKIEGYVYIDVFPIDGMPNDPIKQERHRKKAMKYATLLYVFKIAKYKAMVYKNFKGLFWKGINIVGKYIPEKYFYEKIDKIANKYDFDKSLYASEIIAGYGFKDTMPRIVYNFDGQVMFNDRKFYTFRYPEFYLINIYGDFMRLPPENQRYHHDNVVYWREK